MFGTNSIASASNLTTLSSTTALTIAFWYKLPTFETPTVGADLYNHADSANSQRSGCYLHIPASTMQLTLNISSTTATTSTSGDGTRPFLQSRRWAHYAVTFNNPTNQMLFYVNGTLVSAATNTTNMTSTATTQTVIGRNGTVSGFGVGSLFDFQVIPSVVVLPNDIATLMDPRRQRPDVKGRWFGLQYVSPGSNGTIRDQSGNNNNLTGAIGGAACSQGAEPPWRATLA